jgi:hypothetical protein
MMLRLAPSVGRALMVEFLDLGAAAFTNDQNGNQR